MSSVQRLHARLVHDRRVEILARHLAPLFPANATVLDVGCGDGRVTASVAAARGDLTMTGLDIIVRPNARVPVRAFDGVTIPLPNDAVDAVLLVDVLHHTPDPLHLLCEARRVAKRLIVVKDHLRQGLAARATLQFMDWVGNASHGVPLPYNYWTPGEWRSGLKQAGLTATSWRTELGLYPRPARWVFERSLHFVAALQKDPEPGSPTRTESPGRAEGHPTS
jgi:SAM-dependent methyltransferase